MSRTDRLSARVESASADRPHSKGFEPDFGPERRTDTRTRSSYVTADRVARIRVELGERDLQVLRTIGRFRLVQTHQLQRLHFAGHASEQSGGRVTRRVLKRLHDRDLVHRLERRIGGIRAGSAGHVYALTPLGHRVIGTKSRRRRKEPSLGFVDHTLAATEVASLIGSGGSCELDVLSVNPEPYCWRRSGNQTLKPDLFVRVADDHTELSWFIEIDMGTEAAGTLRRKISDYESYWRSGVEQHREGVFPKVCFVVPDEKRRVHVARIVAESATATQLFDVVTFDRAIEHLTDFGVGS